MSWFSTKALIATIYGDLKLNENIQPLLQYRNISIEWKFLSFVIDMLGRLKKRMSLFKNVATVIIGTIILHKLYKRIKSQKLYLEAIILPQCQSFEAFEYPSVPNK